MPMPTAAANHERVLRPSPFDCASLDAEFILSGVEGLGVTLPAKAEAAFAIHMVFIGEELGTLQRNVFSGWEQSRVLIERHRKQRAAGKLIGRTMDRTCRDADEDHRNARGFVLCNDRLEPLLAVPSV
jgi:hypothetical protein